ncbi:hypothetical protein HJB99_07880 [Rhizobium sp. NLR17b]|uniref:hypothetical protein n=1 Tax=Rhizobium TaxID=379 RepID=UPI001C82918A|nr:MULTISPECIES: hypothetical protein [Rhizobium]MBX4883991.1 hypothetical protein [Rhizobium bangladeshense]MBX5268597.1 hypothetical protein [Rhizobium sp. NLR17b]
MDDYKPGHQLPDSVPISIGTLSRLTIADCIRKWAVGGALTERERLIIDEALAANRLEMIGTVFAGGGADAR